MSTALTPHPPVLDSMNSMGETTETLLLYWNQLKRHLWLVLAVVITVTMATALYTLTLTKLYDAAAVLRIDSASAPNVGSESAQPTNTNDPQLLVTTAQQVVTTPAVVNQAIAALHLERNPEFVPRRSQSPAQAQQALEQNVARNILVTHPPGTLLLEVHFRSFDPAISAQVANGLAQAFLEHEYRTRFQALTQSSEYMSEQLAQLRAESEKSQEDLVNYESTADVLDPDDKTNVMQARLGQINADYTKAQTERMRVEAEYRLVQGGDSNALMAVPGNGQQLLPLRTTLSNDSRELAHMAALYGPSHPLLRRQQQLVQYDQQALQRALAQAGAELQSQYVAAVEQEKMLGASLQNQRAAMDAFNRKAIAYRALKSRADSFAKLFYDLQQRIQEDNISAGFRSEGLRITSPALPNFSPVYPDVPLVAVLAFILSGLVAVGGVLLVSNLDQTISTPTQGEQLFHLPVLAALPAVNPRAGGLLALRPAALQRFEPEPGRLTATSTPRANLRSPFHEAILSLHSILALSPEAVQAIGVTSALPGEGKSTVSANLAAAFALAGHRTVLVDADMRKPNVHRQFGCPNRFGLSTILRDKLPPDQFLIACDIANLSIIPAGPSIATPVELLQRNFSGLIEELRGRFDRIIVDCTPALGFADALAVASSLDALAIVVKAGDTPRQLVAAVLRYFRDTRAALLGIVLNRVSEKMESQYGYARYYSHYYAADTTEQEDEA